MTIAMTGMNPRSGERRTRRRGAALVELVVILPLLAFILVAAADFARAFHDLVTITDCSRNGSLYAAQNPTMTGSAYQSGIAASAMAGSTNLGTTPAVTTASGSLGTQNSYMDVTVSNPFQTLGVYPGIPGQVTISRTIRMRVQPTIYRMQ